MPATSPTAVRPSKYTTSPLNKDSLGRQGASTASSTTNRSSMYGAMSIAVKEQIQTLQNSSEAKKKTLPQRPTTPYGSKNVIEGNKAVSKKIIRREESPPASPRSRPVTPHEIQSRRPVTPSISREKRPTGGILKKKLQDTTPKTPIPRSVSPSASVSAHTSSHQASAHRRSHERVVVSPDKSLLEENRKLKRQVADYEERLLEKENEYLEASDIIEALSQRVEKLERENKSLREQVASSDSTSKLLSGISNNLQRVRGDSPITASISPSPTPDLINPSSKSEVLPSIAPKTTSPPSVGKTTINNSDDVKEEPHIITPTIAKILDPVNSIRSHPKTLDKTMNHNLSPFSSRQSGIAGKQDLQYAKRAVAVRDVIMEDSDESEIDEFDPKTYNTDNNVSDNQIDSDNEEDIDEIGLPQGNLNLVGRNVKHDHHEVSDSNDDELTNENQRASTPKEADVEKKLSPRGLRRPNIIVEQFDDSASGKKVNGNVSNLTQQRSQPRSPFLSTSKDHLSPTYSHLHPHRDSMSSVTSDSSDDSGLSKIDSYSSPITSSSTTCTDNENGISVSSPHSGQSSTITSSINKSKINVLNALNSRPKNPVLASKFNSDTSSDERCPTPVPASQKNTSSGRNVNNGYTPSRLSSQPSSTAARPAAVDSNRSSSPFPARPSPNSGNPNKNGLARQVISESKNRSSSPLIKQVTSNRPSTPARAQSPALTSRASTPTSRRSRLNENVDPSIPPPPPPPTSDDPFTTLQHYLRLIADNSIMDNPLKFYDLQKVIDEGSSAKVYTAYPLSSINEEVAVKIIPLTYSLEFIFNEIYVLKNLKHKNIVDYKQSYLRWDGKIREVWIAMEKCARGDVTSRAGKITPREVSRVTGELLKALKHLHAHGIIHRDLKLSNILAGANNEIKLADFGIASLTPTSTTSMVGTIPYMAPDVVLVSADRPYDTKVDIWSLGICVLELLTGKAAWGRTSDEEIMNKLRNGEKPYGFQRLRSKKDDIGIGWEAIDFLEKCFTRTGDARWSAEKLLDFPTIIPLPKHPSLRVVLYGKNNIFAINP
ncbi:11842_t:CDS:2 [Dentiscutata erythropus]|uniref:11842_t:CDS:1 n=1 Tax=Dentiscutata erythropus TaxID=1348616 RepID=A0A9N8VU23_9GLOM|nr:11842_t:CDS:2 [Dentiscutata erythropus]